MSSTDRLIQFSISLKALHSVRAFKAVFSKLFNCVTKQQILQPANISVSDEHFLPFLTTEDHDTGGKGATIVTPSPRVSYTLVYMELPAELLKHER